MSKAYEVSFTALKNRREQKDLFGPTAPTGAVAFQPRVAASATLGMIMSMIFYRKAVAIVSEKSSRDRVAVDGLIGHLSPW